MTNQKANDKIKAEIRIIGGKYMKMQKKIIRVMMLSISILFVLLTIQTNAVNTTNQENNNTNQTSSSNTAVNKNTNRNTTNQSTTKNTTTKNANNTDNTANTANTTKTKSSNANLSNLGIKPHDFTGFKSGTTSYQAVIPEDTKTVEVYAKTQDAKAIITGTGKKTLESGENKLEVVVTAEDGTKKTYTINITRGEPNEGDENLEEPEEVDGLSTLKIKDVNLSPEFKTDIYEYAAKYIGENTKLEIETIPTSENYKVEVIGNEDIQEGENIITVLVSEKDGDNVATYQITLNKSLVDEEAIAREEAEKQAKQQRTIIGIVVAVVILIAIIVWIVLKRKNKNIAEEFSGVSLYGKNHQDEEKEEEFPKALREEKAEETSDGQEDEKKNQNDLNKEEEKSDKEELSNEEDEIESMPKEQIKEQFLDNYSNYEEEYEAESKEKKKKEKRKGKRFK